MLNGISHAPILDGVVLFYFVLRYLVEERLLPRCLGIRVMIFRCDIKAALQNQHFQTGYRELKSLIVNGYFTSEVGATRERPWIPVPGRWEPSVQIDNGVANV